MSAPENAYETLGLSDGGPSTSESDIKKAYRKLALKKHPDKNPDNPEAAEEFAEIQKAYEILCDKEARSALDEWLRIQSFKKQKLSERDEKRRKMAEDLERREKMVDLKSKENTAKMKLQEQLERLRKDAADRQQNIYSRLVRDKEGDKQISERMNRTVKLNWNENEGLSFESLRDIVSDHGKIEDMVLRDAKIGKSALVVMKSADSVGSLVSSDILSRLKIKVLPLGESFNLDNRKSEVNLHGTNERVEPKLSKNKRVFPATQSASHEMKTRATKVTELEAQVLGRLRSVAKQAGK